MPSFSTQILKGDIVCVGSLYSFHINMFLLPLLLPLAMLQCQLQAFPASFTITYGLHSIHAFIFFLNLGRCKIVTPLVSSLGIMLMQNDRQVLKSTQIPWEEITKQHISQRCCYACHIGKSGSFFISYQFIMLVISRRVYIK